VQNRMFGPHTLGTYVLFVSQSLRPTPTALQCACVARHWDAEPWRMHVGPTIRGEWGEERGCVRMGAPTLKCK
jgi:hypothetical protein